MCPEHTFECRNGRIDNRQSPCISTNQRCDGVTDCIGGEDELDHNCPCEPEEAIRLVDGTVPHRGRVEFCKNGWWSTICSYRFYYWDNNNAAVVCHQLGYPREGMRQVTTPDLCTQYCNVYVLFDHTTGAEGHRGKFLGADISQPLVFDYFQCRGSESSLLECNLRTERVCQHSTDVSVVCSELVVYFVKKVELNSNVYIPECSEVNTFQCMNDSFCVNELQLCDGVADCPSDTDESIGCGNG